MQYIRRTTKEINTDYVYNLLKDRGIIDESNNQKKKYYHPTKLNLIPSEKLDGIEDAYNIVMNHVRNGDSIHIIVDSDVDGYTSASMMYNYLNKNVRERFQNFTLSYRIPLGKEHGLRTIIDEYLDKKKYDLIIVPDGGTNDAEECKLLKEMGYDVVIIDHHLRSKDNPYATIVNNQISNEYNNKDLSGAGMVFKFISYCDNKIGLNEADKYMDLVALGEIADVMNLNTLENRYLISSGLRNINNPMFKALIDKQQYSMGNGDITQLGVAFYISPLLNALIRVGSQREKEELFEGFINGEKVIDSTKRTATQGEKELLSEQCTRYCLNARLRQNKEKTAATELLNIEIMNNCLDEHKILILNADDIDVSTNLTGLIAMEIAAEYKKPTMLGRTTSDNRLKGSIRGQDSSPLKNFRKFLLDSNLMEYVEGHSNAAGFSIEIKNISKLLDYADRELANVDFNQKVHEVDFIVDGKNDDLKTIIFDVDSHKDFWGQQNNEPVVAITHMHVPTNTIQIIGKKENVIKFIYNEVTYIKFNAEDVIHTLKDKDCEFYDITCVGKCKVNEWMDQCSPQIIIDGIEINEDEKYKF